MNLSSLTHRDQLGQWLTEAGLLGTGVEVGVFRGAFSKIILDTWPGKLIGVDVYNQGTEFDILAEAIFRNEIHVKDGRYRIVVNTSAKGAELLPDELDWVFLDGDHSLHAVHYDILAWYPKLKSGGLLSGHDMDKSDCGVAGAVFEFAALNDKKIHLMNDGTWAIQKP